MKAALALLLFGILVALGPLALIWSLNTLFATAIPYTLKSGLAAAFLLLLAGGKSVAAERKDRL